jgi:four helix bundle protein
MDYKKLEIWIESMILVGDVYKLTEELPDNKKFGLISQLRRCAVSVPSNIAEGKGRRSDKSFSNFLKISIGSLYELETHLTICRNLNFIEENLHNKLLKDTKN